jgi:hypothetical protein
MAFAKNYFIKNYVKNTSIEATMNCFNNFPNFNSFFSDTFNINIIKQLQRKIARICGEVIQSMNSKNFSKVKSDLYDLRKQLEKEGLNIKNYDKEIDPGIFIFLFIRKLNSELNEILTPDTKISNEERIKRYKILSRRYSFSPNEIENSFNLLINTYNKKILSFISRNFFSYIKITKTCLGRNHSSCYFDKLYFIPINIKILKQKIGTIFNISLKDAFNSLKNSIAIAYSNQLPYEVGDYVIYGNQLYRCKTTISTAENWNSSHWQSVTLADEVKNLNETTVRITDVITTAQIDSLYS